MGNLSLIISSARRRIPTLCSAWSQAARSRAGGAPGGGRAARVVAARAAGRAADAARLRVAAVDGAARVHLAAADRAREVVGAGHAPALAGAAAADVAGPRGRVAAGVALGRTRGDHAEPLLARSTGLAVAAVVALEIGGPARDQTAGSEQRH